jgi:hypothetical protein
MKTVPVRMNDETHAYLHAAAARTHRSMASYLLQLLDDDKEARAASAALITPPPPKKQPNKREQALAEYAAIMDDLPAIWNQAEYDRVYNAILALRVAGGNISHTETPLPRSMVQWRNASLGYGGIEEYDGMSFEQLDDMVMQLEMAGRPIPKMLDLARRMAMPDVPL